MIWPPQGAALFEFKKPCCECACEFIIPLDPTLGGTEAYGDLEEAHDAMSELVSLCIVYTPYTDYLEYEVLAAGTATLEITFEKTIQCGPLLPPPLPSFPCTGIAEQWFKIKLTTGSVSIPYSVVSGGTPSGGVDEITVIFYNPDYSVADTETDTTAGSTSGTFTPALPGGEYLVKVYCRRQTVNTFPVSPTMAVDISFNFPTGTEFCQAKAAYEDDGIRYLECCAFQCRQKGPAELCGFPELTSPSTPPKKYRTGSLSGTMAGCVFSPSESCEPSNFIFGQLIEWTGVCSFNSPPDTCEVSTTTGTQTVSPDTGSLDGCGSWGSPSSIILCEQTDFYTDPVSALNAALAPYIVGSGGPISPTIYERSGDGCVPGGGASQSTDGDLIFELTDEDTDADAIARVDASDWTDWGETSLCYAAWEVRTSGFTFDYRVSEWRVRRGGLAPLTTYKVSVEIWRRLYATGDYTLLETVIAEDETDADGLFEVSAEIPNSEGYQTIARCDCHISPA